MGLDTKISIGALKIGNHPVEIPEGLSELLSDTWVIKKKESSVRKNYNHQVIKKEGHFVTLLTKK